MVVSVTPADSGERWASLGDPYIKGYTPSLGDGDYGDPGTQLIDPWNAVAGLTGSLWTSRAGETLVSGRTALPAGGQVKPAELPSLVYHDNAPSSTRTLRSSKGATTALLTEAFGLTGRPYRQGQSTPQAGFDNIGFVSYVYSKTGIRLPRRQSPADLVAVGKPVVKDDLRPGDMVVYNDPKSPGNYLLGVYSGNGNFLLASPRLNVVAETAAFGTDYGPYFVGGRRLYEDPAAAPLSEEEKMAATNGAVKVALSQLGEIPRFQPVSQPRTYSRSKGKARVASGKKARSSGKKAYSRGSGRSSKAKAATGSRGTYRRIIRKKG
jgi:cell wall-associated NlpC family hydrolase